MAVTLTQVVEHLVAMDGLEPVKARGIAREVIAALGLLVNARNDEVYNPAPADEPLSARTDNWRASMGARRRGVRR